MPNYSTAHGTSREILILYYIMLNNYSLSNDTARYPIPRYPIVLAPIYS